MKTVKYKPLNLPEQLVKELTDMRQEISNKRGKNITFEKMIREMIAYKKKYEDFELYSLTIQDLNDWREAYSKSWGEDVPLETAVNDMIECSRKYNWGRNRTRRKDKYRVVELDGKDLVQSYKAILLARKKGISFEDAKNLVVDYDNDSTKGFSFVRESHCGRVFDKDWRDLL